jgi:hypothetical protein
VPQLEPDRLKLKRKGRKRRMMGWTLLTLGVLVAAVWVSSRWWWARWTGQSYRVEVGYGTIALRPNFPPGSMGPTCWNGGRVPPQYREWDTWLGWSFSRSPELSTNTTERRAGVFVLSLSDYYGSGAMVTLWPIPLMLWPPAALLLRSGYVAHRRATAGACTKCGYSLAGLTSGVPCPECGRTATPVQR